MHVRAFVLFLISIGCVSMSPTIESQELPFESLPKPISMIWNVNLQDLSDRWRILYPELQTSESYEPREKIFSSDKRTLADKYEYDDKYLSLAAKIRAANERAKSRAQDNISKWEKFLPLQNIFFEPGFCKEGQSFDSANKCNSIIPPEKNQQRKDE